MLPQRWLELSLLPLAGSSKLAFFSPTTRKSPTRLGMHSRICRALAFPAGISARSEPT